MRAVLGEAARHRPFPVMSGAYFVCGLILVFLATHLPTYLAICGQDPMLRARPEIIESTSDSSVNIEFTTTFSYHIWWL